MSILLKDSVRLSQTVMPPTHLCMNTTKQPLRRVLGYVPAYVSGYRVNDRELLECGHEVRIKTDRIGETYAVRRRCRKCAAGAPPDRVIADG